MLFSLVYSRDGVYRSFIANDYQPEEPPMRRIYRYEHNEDSPCGCDCGCPKSEAEKATRGIVPPTPAEIAACTGDASCPNYYTGGDYCCAVSETLAQCAFCGRSGLPLFRMMDRRVCEECHA